MFTLETNSNQKAPTATTRNRQQPIYETAALAQTTSLTVLSERKVAFGAAQELS